MIGCVHFDINGLMRGSGVAPSLAPVSSELLSIRFQSQLASQCAPGN